MEMIVIGHCSQASCDKPDKPAAEIPKTKYNKGAMQHKVAAIAVVMAPAKKPMIFFEELRE